MALNNTLSDFINKLDNTEPEELPKLLKSFSLDTIDFEPYKLWKKDGYSRNCIKRNRYYELILLCWNPGDKSPVHNHNGQKCWVYQLEGTISEIRYEESNNKLTETQKLSLYPSRLTYMDDNMGCHRLVNDSDEPAVSLHIYMSPIDSCEYFCEEDKIFKKKTLKYDNDFVLS